MEINKLTAYCGLTCDSCPIYLATRENDQEKQKEMRIQIAEFASKYYGTILESGDITDCDGCTTRSGRLYSGCSQCEVRKCAQKKDCLTCAHCPEYPCDPLQKFFVAEPDAKSNLDHIRKCM
ncbi:DUF3795 domain-containing protein [bacterium]|nr:DUF3795 domain-containing protein [bacterium]